MVDLDAKSIRHRACEKVLADHEKQKKTQYLGPCLEQRRHFAPFVVSTDGLLAREAKFFWLRMARLLANKWKREYSQVAGYLNTRLSIAIVRATHRCLRGSRVSANKISSSLPSFEDGAGLGLPR